VGAPGTVHTPLPEVGHQVDQAAARRRGDPEAPQGERLQAERRHQQDQQRGEADTGASGGGRHLRPRRGLPRRAQRQARPRHDPIHPGEAGGG